MPWACMTLNRARTRQIWCSYLRVFTAPECSTKHKGVGGGTTTTTTAATTTQHRGGGGGGGGMSACCTDISQRTEAARWQLLLAQRLSSVRAGTISMAVSPDGLHSIQFPNCTSQVFGPSGM